MSAEIIDGKALACEIRKGIAEEISKMPSNPGLAVIMVGNNPSSAIYVRNKEKACEVTWGMKEKIIMEACNPLDILTDMLKNAEAK